RRLEVVRFDGFTAEEEGGIGPPHLWPRQIERNGLRSDEVTVDDAVLRLVVREYTREAGVRQLERELGTLLRRTATQLAAATHTAPIALHVPPVAHPVRPPQACQEPTIPT